MAEQVFNRGNGKVEFASGDSCPECGESLQWDNGDTIDCENCGGQYDVDWTRMLEPLDAESDELSLDD